MYQTDSEDTSIPRGLIDCQVHTLCIMNNT